MSNAATLDLGQCWGRPNGQSLSSPSYLASGVQCVAEAVADRWSTTNKSLIDDPTYGRNVANLVGDDLSESTIAYEQAQLAAQAELDERVLTMAVSLILTNGVLVISGQGTTKAGPFTLVGAVSSSTPLSFQVQT